jgi:SWI/SNF related-matrix-associated actin-dependent regulator of chromatin subfamily C
LTLSPSTAAAAAAAASRLLEGLELYKEDWAAVAAHVGTRSQAACLAHFVRLPIEDQFVEDIADWGQPGTAAAAAPAPAAAGQSSAAAAAGEQPVLPFQDEGNPVLAVVVSLAVLLGPKVASAAAQRAMQVLVEGDAAAAADLAVSARIAAGPPAPAAAAAAVNGDAAADGAAAAGVEAAAAAAEAAGNGNAANGTAEEGGQEAAAAAAANGDPPVPDPARPVSKQLMLAAVAAGLAAAAARAKQQAWAEERDMQRLMVMVADAQLRKVAAKTKLLAEMTQVRRLTGTACRWVGGEGLVLGFV